ncbi:MAG: aldehyde ferredoxin oxidoreductase N-terminal domain-containing protein, partial [Chloroflexota bacterium]
MQPILRVDLTLGKIDTLEIPPAWERDFLGGASLAARLLYDHLRPDLDPLDPQAPLLFLNGPLSGTSGPAVGRFVVCGRSPATRLWGESNCGGFWGPELRQAGFDGLWISGRAAAPVYLWVQDGRAEIRPALHLWGLDPYATQAAVEAELDA